MRSDCVSGGFSSAGITGVVDYTPRQVLVLGDSVGGGMDLG